ncbi:hypothetical protein PAXRUDRAFT_131797 [Paxillus rubicundulus Ve08.2h10]|uniref:Uncharacterized protein n=1 Tax=Paxillus rubicundulus Ve08.2h10 TaxID=930991 RepID=A0A0D0DWB6_9AGAM|nr:hypothetical protein PAXRUDRAFT_131797 [Paxillus rubicundulus Ve08.2h10]
MGTSKGGTSVTKAGLVKQGVQEKWKGLDTKASDITLEDGNADKDAEKLHQARTFVSSEIVQKKSYSFPYGQLYMLLYRSMSASLTLTSVSASQFRWLVGFARFHPVKISKVNVVEYFEARQNHCKAHQGNGEERVIHYIVMMLMIMVYLTL